MAQVALAYQPMMSDQLEPCGAKPPAHFPFADYASFLARDVRAQRHIIDRNTKRAAAGHGGILDVGGAIKRRESCDNHTGGRQKTSVSTTFVGVKRQ